MFKAFKPMFFKISNFRLILELSQFASKIKCDLVLVRLWFASADYRVYGEFFLITG